MAQPFLRIDLTNQAKDFQNTVIEAGWPLIDKANANYQILRKWLGSAVAEPERQGEEVVFYLRNDAGARIDQPRVKKVSDKELPDLFVKGLLKKLEAAQPRNTSERNLHAKAVKELQELNSEKRASDRRCCFFKYQDEQDKKKWHLVWAPGYRRKDEQPARPIICTNASCSLLFLERADTSDKCPRCNTKPAAGGVAAGEGVRKSSLPLVLVLLLLIAVLGGAGWWYMNRDTGEAEGPAEAVLAVSPASATITRNGQITYTASFTDTEGNKTDVTKDVSVVVRLKDGEKAGKSEFHKVPVKYNTFENKAEAQAVGTAELEFFYIDAEKKKHTARATLVVKPPENPKVVKIEPAKIKLGVGTTAQLKMIGEYEDGSQEDLTKAAEWNWDDLSQSGPVFAYQGAVQGINVGRTKLQARFRATKESEYVIAEADVEVADVQYSALKLALAKEKVAVGQDPGLTVEAVSQDGTSMSVLGSSLLNLEVDPEAIAKVTAQPPYLYPVKPGKATLTATFRGITKELAFEVEDSKGPGALALEVNPKNLKLAVGEIADVDVPGPGGLGILRFASSDLEVVEVTPRNRLIGKKPGKATVTVSRDDEKATVAVEVVAVPFVGIAFDPEEVSVRVDDVVALRVMGAIDEGTQVELDPQILEWVRLPAGEYVEVNKDALDVRGLQPTGEDAKTLTVRLGEHEASAKVRVIPGPLQLALEPAGDLELAVGQKQVLKVIATYGNGRSEEIPAGRVEWLADPVDGLALNGGEVSADKPEAGPLRVSVRFQDQTSNEVAIHSVASAPIILALAADPAKLAVGEAGKLLPTATTPGGQDVDLDMKGVTFESADPGIVEVDPATGGFRGAKAGRVMLTATHAPSGESASVEVEVAPPTSDAPPKPQGVRIVTKQQAPIPLPIGVGFVDYDVIANIDGEDVDVSEEATLIVQGDPQNAKVQIRDGVIYGIEAGEAAVKAEVGGMTSENELRFNVTETIELDEIKLIPGQVNLAVAENTRMIALAFHEGRNVGVINDLEFVTWKSEKESVATTEGPLVSAVAAGTTGITASVDEVVSNAAQVTVAGEGVPSGDNLRVDPAAITLRPGESQEIGRDIRVLRGDADLSRQATVSSANPEIVAYDEESHTIKAGLPGTARVTFAVGDQLADLEVTVLAEAAPTAGGRVVIEPGSGTIAVAERLPLQVFLITAEGERVNMSETALLKSSNPSVAVTTGAGARGVAPGSVTISASLPGVESPGTASFKVENIDFTRIQVDPARIDIASGETTRFEISVVGPGGRRILGADPDLTITEILHVDDESRTRSRDVPEDWRQYEGIVTGTHQLNIKWRNLETTVPCRVRDGQITGIVIRPSDRLIGVGESLDYQVFARRGRGLSPLSAADGVELSVANSVVASKDGLLRVLGESEGVTEVIAQFGNQQAGARLRVGPRTIPVAPPARPVGLRFSPDTLRMELGAPGHSVRIVRLNADGSNEEVAHLAELTADPDGIVEVRNSPSGPVIHPKTIGQTQVHAKVGNLATETPMLVEVVNQLPDRPRVVVTPRVVSVNVGERETLNQVAVVPSRGARPIELPYKITATQNRVFSIEDDRVIRGDSPGEAIATVTIDDPGGKYDGESATVSVRVSDPAADTVLANDSELELTGPTRTTEGSEVGYRIRLVAGSSARDVTSDSALVLTAGDEEFAKAEPGCRLIALKPGTVNVRARYGGRVSNTIPLRINPVSTDFERLVLEISTRPLAIGESREYRVWGYPGGGRLREDLTRLVTTDRDHPSRPYIRFSADPNADVATHAAPNIIGRNPGTASIQAAISDRVVSRKKTIHIVGEVIAPVDLRVEPGSITSRVGETTPPLKVLIRAQGDRRYRELDPASVEFVSLNTDVANPIAESPGRFTAKGPGRTRIRVSYQGKRASVNLAVVADRFQSIDVGKTPDWVGITRSFTVPITIRTDRFAEDLEYRVYRPGAEPPANQGWKSPTVEQGGTRQFTKLTSPQFDAGRSDIYTVRLQCRVKGTNEIESYPYAFRLGIDSERRPGAEP